MADETPDPPAIVYAEPIREYPRWVRKPGEPELIVNSAEELAALIASNGEGWE